jgi:hypothetical protein
MRQAIRPLINRCLSVQIHLTMRTIVDISLGIRDSADGMAFYGLAEFMIPRQREELTEA